MSGLWSGIEELGSEDLSEVDTETLGQDIVMVGIAIDQLEAERVRRLAAFDTRAGYAEEGSLSTESWLVARSHLAPGAAKQRVEISHRMEGLPKVAAAFAAGEVGYGQVRVLCDATKDLDAEFVGEAQETLLDESRRCEPRKLERRLAHWRHRGDAAKEVERARKQRARQEIRVAPKAGGMVGMQGDLDAEGGATLLTALDALSAPDPSGVAARTVAQRRADALVELARRPLDTGDLPERGGERPHLAVTVSLETLEGRAGAPGADRGWGGVITGEAARRLACDCKINRVITDGASQPLDVGRATRVPPPALRRALVVRDRGCVFPDCDRPPAWCDVHHFVPWINGGPTNPDNCGLLCSAHHHLVHEGGWQIRRNRDGRILVRPPPHVMRR
jgi:hypothetical protein